MVQLVKNYSESFKRSLLIIFAYGIAFGLGYLTRIFNPYFAIPFYISEQEKITYYYLNLKDVLDLLFIGPIFTLFSFILLKRILDDLRIKGLSENKILVYYALFLIAIVLYNYGNMIHVTMNRLNSQVIDKYNTEDFYYQIYYLDEMIGHHFITIGFFIVLTEVCLLHTSSLMKAKTNSEFLLKNREPFWNYIFGLGLGIATAFAYLEGQCAFLFLILNPIICLILVMCSYKTSGLIKKNSLLMIFIIMTIVFAIIVLIWAGVTGIKPYYPYFYQNSEL
ncbi:MAG: hypothetical protein EU535_07470 [Promethearchaeota archaeon]|nr:MAG: hypothetical protein EU535_07470 [Candidatus Lokiarchaeota archaeon]